VHALRLRNELPLQVQLPEPKMFYGGVGERVITMLQTLLIKPNFIFYDKTTRTYFTLFPASRALSPAISRKGYERGEGAAARFVETIRPDNGRLDYLPHPLPHAGEGEHRCQLQ